MRCGTGAAGVLVALGLVAFVPSSSAAQQRATAIVVELDGARAGAVEIAARNSLSRVGAEVMDSGAVRAARALNGMASGVLDEAKAEQLRSVLGVKTLMVYSGAANGPRIFVSVRLHHSGGVLRRFATSSDSDLAVDVDRMTGELLTELATTSGQASAAQAQPTPAQPAQPAPAQPAPTQPQPAQPQPQPYQPQPQPYQPQPAQPQPQPAQPQPAQSQPQPYQPQPAQPQPAQPQPQAQPYQPQPAQPAPAQPAQPQAGSPDASGSEPAETPEAAGAAQGDNRPQGAPATPDGAAREGRTVIGLQYGTGGHGLGPALRFELPLFKPEGSMAMSLNLGIDVGLVFDWGGSGSAKFWGLGIPLFAGPTYRLSFGPITIGARAGMHAQLRYTNVSQGSFWAVDMILGVDIGITAEYTGRNGTGVFLGLDGIIREGSEAFVVTIGAAL